MPEVFTSDSVAFFTPSPEVSDTLSSAISEPVFDSASILAQAPDDLVPRMAERLSVTGNFAYETLIVLTLILYCYILYNYRSSIILLFTVLVRKKASTEKLMEEKTQFFRQFTILSSILDILVITGIVLRLENYFGLTERFDPVLMQGFLPWLVPLTIGAVASVVGYKIALTSIASYITENQHFFEAYRALGRLFSTIAVLLVTPFFLLAALTENNIALPLLWIVGGVAVILYLIFLQKSYQFFKERKVSILQWFLYLCAVEFFPVSFFILLGTRFV